MHPRSEQIPPFCIASSVKMYIFYRFIDIYRFSTSSPAHGGVFYVLTKCTPYFSAVFVQPGEAGRGQDTAGCDPSPSKPLPHGEEGAGQGSSSMAEGARSWLLAQLCHCQGPLAAPGGRCRLAHFQHPVLLLQQQSCEFRQSSSSRRCYFQKKTHNHNPQTSAPGSAASPSPGGLSPGRSCWSSQMVPSGIEVKQSPLELPSTILSKEAE